MSLNTAVAALSAFPGAFATNDGAGVTQLHIPGVTANCPAFGEDYLVRRMDAALAEELEVFDATRKDADEDPDVRTLMFRHFLRQKHERLSEQRGLNREDARSTGNRFMRRAARTMRGIADIPRSQERRDAGAYYENSLNQVVGSPIHYPIRNLSDLLSGIPVRMVSPGLETWEKRYVSGYGNAKVHRPGSSDLSFVGVSRTAAKRRLHTFVVGLLDDWLERLHEGYSGIGNAAERMVQVGRALDELQHLAIKSGIDGLDLQSLDDIPMLRRASSLVYGTATMDAIYNDMMGGLIAAKQSSEDGAAFDTAIISERIIGSVELYTNWVGGNNTTGGDLLAKGLAREGVRRIIIGKSMRNFGGTNIDGALFFSSDSETGLAQVMGMRAAPVHRFTHATGDATVYATRSGGLELPLADSAYLYTAEVTP